MQTFGEMMRFTAWHNPTKTTVRARIFTGPDTGYKVFEVPPGETRELPSDYDAAIQNVRGGRVVSGLAPQLRRAVGKTPPLDPALDAEGAAARARELETQRAVAAKAAADLAVKKAAEAEAQVLLEQAQARATAESQDKKPKSEEAPKGKK
jgi:hypothetical protein